MKRFRMFAGPNGSGKSTFIHAIKDKCFIGYYINADDIERELYTANGKLDYRPYIPHLIFQENWDEFVGKLEIQRLKTINIRALKVVDYELYIFDTTLNSYLAAIIAEFFRYELLKSDKSFSFETVMSHVSKVDFLHQARANGFKTYLYFICTSDPEINKNRVTIRVSKGGHAVDENKIVERYYRSLELLKDAFLAVDRAYVCDSSEEDAEQVILFEKKDNEIKFHTDVVPEWILEYLINHLQLIDPENTQQD